MRFDFVGQENLGDAFEFDKGVPFVPLVRSGVQWLVSVGMGCWLG